MHPFGSVRCEGLYAGFPAFGGGNPTKTLHLGHSLSIWENVKGRTSPALPAGQRPGLIHCPEQAFVPKHQPGWTEYKAFCHRQEGLPIRQHPAGHSEQNNNLSFTWNNRLRPLSNPPKLGVFWVEKEQGQTPNPLQLKGFPICPYYTLWAMVSGLFSTRMTEMRFATPVEMSCSSTMLYVFSNFSSSFPYFALMYCATEGSSG